MTISPGAFLKLRRTAAGLSVADLAAKLVTEPRMAEHLRAEWIELIEADITPASFNTIVSLRHCYPFSLNILEELSAIGLGLNLAPPQICRICGWNYDERDPADDCEEAPTEIVQGICSGCARSLEGVA
jgi:transcriptional regulator with XRE-family HTH domain